MDEIIFILGLIHVPGKLILVTIYPKLSEPTRVFELAGWEILVPTVVVGINKGVIISKKLEV
jgi:hypothetical protein